MDRPDAHVVWRLRVSIFVFTAVVGAAVAVFLAFRGSLVGSAVFLGLVVFESWRARTVYRDRPSGPPLDERKEMMGRARRMRISATVVTVAAVGELIAAAVAHRAVVWALGVALAVGAVLVWVITLWVIPGVERRGHKPER